MRFLVHSFIPCVVLLCEAEAHLLVLGGSSGVRCLGGGRRQLGFWKIVDVFTMASANGAAWIDPAPYGTPQHDGTRAHAPGGRASRQQGTRAKSARTRVRQNNSVATPRQVAGKVPRLTSSPPHLASSVVGVLRSRVLSFTCARASSGVMSRCTMGQRTSLHTPRHET